MKTNLVRLFGFLSLSAVGACSSPTERTALEPSPREPEVPRFTCIDNSATRRLPADLRATLPAFGPRTPDDALVAISQSVPGGFAGIFFEGHYVLTFVDPARATQARAEIQDAFVSHGLGGLDVRAAEIRGARWSFAELDEWYRYLTPKVSEQGSGVSSSDIDERANTIAFSVIDESARARLKARIASLGVPCNLVTTVIRPYAIAL